MGICISNKFSENRALGCYSRCSWCPPRSSFSAGVSISPLLYLLTSTENSFWLSCLPRDAWDFTILLTTSLFRSAVSNWLIGAAQSLAPYLKRGQLCNTAYSLEGSPSLTMPLPAKAASPLSCFPTFLGGFQEEYTLSKCLVPKSLSLALLLGNPDLRQQAKRRLWFLLVVLSCICLGALYIHITAIHWDLCSG